MPAIRFFVTAQDTHAKTVLRALLQCEAEILPKLETGFPQWGVVVFTADASARMGRKQLCWGKSRQERLRIVIPDEAGSAYYHIALNPRYVPVACRNSSEYATLRGALREAQRNIERKLRRATQPRHRPALPSRLNFAA